MVFHALVFSRYIFKGLKRGKHGLMAFYVLMCSDHSFRRTQNFEPSHGMCVFPWNFCVFAEFCWIRHCRWEWDKCENYVLYLYMISPWNTRLPLGLYKKEYWKYSAELIWNIASLFCRHCLCQLQLLTTNTVYLVGFWGHEKLKLLYVENLPWWAAEFAKICHGELWPQLICH